MDTSITEKLHEARLRVGYAITELGSMIAMWIMGSRRRVQVAACDPQMPGGYSHRKAQQGWIDSQKSLARREVQIWLI